MTGEPAGDSQGKQGHTCQTCNRHRSWCIERRTEQERCQQDGNASSAKPAPTSITAVTVSSFFMLCPFSICFDLPRPPRLSVWRMTAGDPCGPPAVKVTEVSCQGLLLLRLFHPFRHLRFHGIEVEARAPLHRRVLEGRLASLPTSCWTNTKRQNSYLNQSKYCCAPSFVPLSGPAHALERIEAQVGDVRHVRHGSCHPASHWAGQ